MTFGFNLHIICGRIGSMRERLVDGTKVINVRILAKNSQRKTGDESFWIEASIWGRYAEIFKSENFKRGDRLSVSLSSLKQAVWQDKFGNCHSTLMGNVDKFWDLRTGAMDDEEFLAIVEGKEELKTSRVKATQRESSQATDDRVRSGKERVWEDPPRDVQGDGHGQGRGSSLEVTPAGDSGPTLKP